MTTNPELEALVQNEFHRTFPLQGVEDDLLAQVKASIALEESNNELAQAASPLAVANLEDGRRRRDARRKLSPLFLAAAAVTILVVGGFSRVIFAADPAESPAVAPTAEQLTEQTDEVGPVSTSLDVSVPDLAPVPIGTTTASAITTGEVLVPAAGTAATTAGAAGESISQATITSAASEATENLGGSDSAAVESTTAPETTTATQVTSSPASGSEVDPAKYALASGFADVGFVSPSGTKTCALTATTVTCANYGYTYPEAERIGQEASECPTPWGVHFAVDVDSSVGALTCVTDASGATEVLPYGSSLTYGSATCTSAETGVRCWIESTGAGFEFSNASYTLF